MRTTWIPTNWIDWNRAILAQPNGRMLVAAVAGFMLGVCFPPFFLWFVIPLPFMLFYNVVKRGQSSDSFRLGFVFAVTFFATHTFWFYSFHPLALPFMLVWLGVWFGVWTYSIQWIGWNPWTATTGWVIVQWVLGVGYHAFPWSRIATALGTRPEILQPVRFMGELAWGGMVVLFGFAAGDWWHQGRSKTVTVVLLVLISVLVFEGYLRVHHEPVYRNSREALLVQPNIESSWNPENPYTQLRTLTRMTQSKARPGDLVVWPETAVMREPLKIENDHLQWTSVRWQQYFLDLMEPGFDLFFGLRFTDPVPNRLPRLNGATLLSSNGSPVYFYTKQHPVPGGEHLPLMGSVPAVRKLGRMLGTMGYRAGEKGGLIPFEVNGNRWKIGVQICFEDAFSGLVREQVHRGADILINISNDSWSRSRASHWQHFYRARIRAIETGRMVLRNGNTGASALIDPMGRILKMLEPYRKGTLRGQLVSPIEMPFYTKWGDWVTLSFVIFMGIMGITREYIR